MAGTLTPGATGVLALADGTVFQGIGAGAAGSALGEVCFNTAMTGYQEILTDPSYMAQIVAFTFPHVGNVGVNLEDIEQFGEGARTAARGAIFRDVPTAPANWRAEHGPAGDLDGWLKRRGVVALAGIDTRALTRRIRENGMPHAVIAHAPDGRFDLDALIAQARARGDTKTATALSALGPPPWTQAKLGVERRMLMAYAPVAETRINMAFPGYLLTAPGYSLGDVVQFMRGMLGSQTVLVPQVEAWKAERLGRDFQVPMIFIQGTDDLQTPTPVVKDYFDWIRAPRKDFVLVPGGGHTALLSHATFVLQILRDRARPLAMAADAEPVTPSTASPEPRS